MPETGPLSHRRVTDTDRPMGDVLGFSRGQREHSLRETADLLGVPPRRVRALARAAGLEPDHLSFQDVAFLRRLIALEAHPVRGRRLKRAPRRLREERARRPGEGAAGGLSGVGLEAAGSLVAVRDERGLWNPESRQCLLDFALRPAAEVTPLPRAEAHAAAPHEASIKT